MKARDVMVAPVITASPNASVKSVAETLVRHRISAVPVVDEREGLVGIVSEEDLILKEAEPRLNDQPLIESRRHRRRRTKAAGSSASEVMTRRVVSIGPAASVEEAARRMAEQHIKRLPVVGENGRLLGIISRVDLLKVYLRDDGEIRQEVVDRAVMPSLQEGAQDVTVDVDGGEVILHGHVVRRSLAEGIADFARLIEGVVSVHNTIEWDQDDMQPGAYAWVGTVMPPERWT